MIPQSLLVRMFALRIVRLMRADDVCGFCLAASGHFPSCPFYGR